jgi:hypothetical protein
LMRWVTGLSSCACCWLLHANTQPAHAPLWVLLFTHRLTCFLYHRNRTKGWCEPLRSCAGRFVLVSRGRTLVATK